MIQIIFHFLEMLVLGGLGMVKSAPQPHAHRKVALCIHQKRQQIGTSNLMAYQNINLDDLELLVLQI